MFRCDPGLTLFIRAIREIRGLFVFAATLPGGDASGSQRIGRKRVSPDKLQSEGEAAMKNCKLSGLTRFTL
jgi:hypothetical protein